MSPGHGGTAEDTKDAVKLGIGGQGPSSGSNTIRYSWKSNIK